MRKNENEWVLYCQYTLNFRISIKSWSYYHVKSCLASSDWNRGWEVLSVVFWELWAVEPIFEKSRSTIDFLIDCWLEGKLLFSYRLRALALLRWYWDRFYLSAWSFFWIFPFLVEGLSLVLPIIVREAALSKVLSYLWVCCSRVSTLCVTSTSCFCIV